MKSIDVKFELCTLYKGKPFGPAVFIHKDANNKDFSFKGVGIFDETGCLQNSPFTAVKLKDKRCSFYSNMINGRPAENSFRTAFYSKGE